MLLKHGVRSIPADTENQTLAELNLALSLNLRCAIQCMQALLASMKDAGFGRIVNMPSRAALGKELRLAYKETAAGLIGITRIWTLKSKNLVLRSMPLLGTV